MIVKINLPPDVENSLLEAWGDNLDQRAFEAVVIQGYREKLFSIGRVAQLVGLETSIQAEQWLTDRRVERNFDVADVLGDYSTLDSLGPPTVK